MVLVIIASYAHLSGQSNKKPKFCQEGLLGKSFISDGQDHIALLRKNKTAKFYVVFYPQFRYKLVVCSNSKQLPVEFRVMDSNGKIFFSNADKDYIREWEFQYSSLMNAIIEVKLTGNEVKEENLRLLIGYKSL
jgi:hypothetical protein